MRNSFTVDLNEGMSKEMSNFGEQYPFPYLQTKYDGTIKSINRAGRAVYGKGVMGKSIFSLFANLKKSNIKKLTSANPLQIEETKKDKTFLFKIVKDTDTKTIHLYGFDITERKQAEEVLRRYENIVSTSADMLALLDKNYIFLTVNKKYAEAFNKTPTEIVGKTVTEVFGEEFFNTVTKPNADRCMDGEEVNYQGWIEFPSIGLKYIQATYSTYIDTDDNITGFIVSGSDMTERKQAEEKLRESEEKFRSLSENSPNMIFIIQKRKIVYANNKCEEFTGYKVEDLISPEFNFLSLILPEHINLIKKKFVKYERTGEESTMECTLMNKRGERIETIINWNQITFMGKKSLLGMVTDITERVKRTDQIRKLSHAVEQSPVSVVITDTKGKIEYVNSKYVEVTGYTLDEVIGKNPRILNSGNQSDEFYSDLWKTISSGKEWRGEFHNRKKNGDLFWESASISPVFNANKKITHYIAVKEDITTQRELEKQLQEVQRIDAVGQLAGGVAHDFNNHLAAIVGYTELCLMSVEKDSQLAEDLRAIINRARQGANLVGQLLAFSRKQVVSIKPVDLNQIVEETLSFIKPLLGEDIMLDEELDHGIPDIQADPTAVDQIITNLCLNARDAMRGGGKITISTKLVSIDEEYSNSHVEALIGDYVVLSVSDDGTGMDEETLSRIYEPFFTTKEVGKGSGLGLSMVYGLMKQHGGFVECSSELGLGTEFKIYFAVTGSAIKHRALKPDEEPVVLGGSETILLVEDDEDVLKIEKSGLEREGYIVLTAENGRDALRLYKKNRKEIDIVVTDVVLPLMSGIDFYESVQDIDPDARFLFISGYAEGILKQKFNFEKDIEILKKPFKNQHMVLKVREILDG